MIVIFGNGMIASCLEKYFSQKDMLFSIVDRSIIDAEQADWKKIMDVLDFFTIYDSVTIINTINVNPWQSPYISIQSYFRINTRFPYLLSECCQVLKFPLYHLSTSCVFSPSLKFYQETDVANACDIYGRSRSLGEPLNCCIIRVDVLGLEPNGKGCKYFLNQMLKNPSVDVASNAYWNGITCLQLAKILRVIIINKVYWIGVKHYYSAHPISLSDLAFNIKRIYQLTNIEIKLNNSKAISRLLDSKYRCPFEIPEIITAIIKQKSFLEK